MIGFMYLSAHYANTRPREPEPRSGHVVRLSNHGSVAYLTHHEDGLLQWMWKGGLGVFIAGGFMLRWAKGR